MDDTPYINDGADASLRKTVSLLNKIEAKTGSTTITGPVTVSNEVEVTNDEGNPLPVSGTVTATQSTASNLKAQSQLLDSTGTLVDYATIGTAGTPSADVVTVQGISGGVLVPVSANNIPLKAFDDAFDGGDVVVAQLVNADGEVSVENPLGVSVSNSVSVSSLPSISGSVEVTNLGSNGVLNEINTATNIMVGTSDAIQASLAESGSPKPAYTIQVGGNDGTNIRTLNVDSSGYITSNINGTVPVSGTFWPATQPVSGSVSVSNFPATQAVSGTVTANTGLSQPLTDAQLRATAVPVSGTFWPTTQPVSGSVSVSNFPATQPVSGTVGISGTVPVSGTFWQTTQPVSIASAISQRVQGWDIPIHDYRGLGYTSGSLTSVTYKTGGASGTTVATLTLGYDGSGNLTSVTKT